MCKGLSMHTCTSAHANLSAKTNTVTHLQIFAAAPPPSSHTPCTPTHAQLFKRSRSPPPPPTPLSFLTSHPCSIRNSAPLPLTASHPHLPWVDGPPSLPSGASERRAKSPPNPQGLSSVSWNWAHRVAFILKSPCSIPIINDYPGLTTIRIDQNQGLKARREQAGG